MYSDSETRSKVLHGWCDLAGLHELLPHLQFYIDYGILSSPSGLYKLNVRHLFINPDVTDDVAYPTIDKLDQAREFSYARVLLALLPSIEPNLIREVVQYPCDPEELVEKVGNPEGLLEELMRLQQMGIDMSFGDDPIFDELEKAAETPFTDKSVVVAGTLSDDHDVVKSALESLGASIQDEISEKTDFLILGEGAGEQADKAIKMRVRVLTEMDVAAMLGVV